MKLERQVITSRSTPLSVGKPYEIIATRVTGEVFGTKKDLFIVFHNPVRKLWHAAWTDGGALVATGTTKRKVMTKVLADAATADPKVVEKQRAWSADRQREAVLLSPKEWFSAFDNDRSKPRSGRRVSSKT